MLNKAILIGRLTRDPDVKYLQNGTPVASFTLAIDRTFKNKDGQKEADFIPVVAWRKTAELCGKYLAKGSQVAVSGRIQTRSYDANDGSKRYVTEVVADEVHFIGSKSDSPRNNYGDNDNFGVPMDGFEEIDDLDVPF
ncbi:MAG: single-stranded DNA-binding protein [Anaerofustis sp.]